MASLVTKTTVLFEPRQYEQLKRIAASNKRSVGDLIRQAVAEKYSLSDRRARIEAVERLSKMSAPAGDWKEMEAEIIAGATR